MKAIVKTEHAPKALALLAAPRPVAGPGEVLLRVVNAAVCGSDLHAYQDDASYQWVSVPVILGHEFCAIVESVGSGVSEFAPGDPVVVEAIQGCLQCESCQSGQTQNCERLNVIGLHQNGAFAEFVVTRASYLHRLPDDFDLSVGCLVEPLSVAYHAVAVQTSIRDKELAVVMGPGPIGLLCAIVAKLQGAEVIVVGTDADEQIRLPIAQKLGFVTVNVSQKKLAEELAERYGKNQADLVIECSGSAAAVDSALRLLKKGGQLTMVGLFSDLARVDLSQIVRREIRINGSYGSNAEDYRNSIAILAAKGFPVELLLTAYPLERAQEAFENALAKTDIKPVFRIMS